MQRRIVPLEPGRALPRRSDARQHFFHLLVLFILRSILLLVTKPIRSESDRFLQMSTWIGSAPLRSVPLCSPVSVAAVFVREPVVVSQSSRLLRFLQRNGQLMTSHVIGQARRGVTKKAVQILLRDKFAQKCIKNYTFGLENAYFRHLLSKGSEKV